MTGYQIAGYPVHGWKLCIFPTTIHIHPIYHRAYLERVQNLSPKTWEIIPTPSRG